MSEQAETVSIAEGPARLYGGDSPATGEDARFALERDALLITAGERTHAVPLSVLRTREVGTGRIGLELAWEVDRVLRALQIFDAAALNALRSDPRFAALPQMAALRTDRRRQSVRRSIGWTALAIFLLLPLLVLLIFIWQADRLAAMAAKRIPIEQEIAMGQQAFESMRGSLQLQDSGPAYEAVRTLGQRLTATSRYSYQFHVAKNDAINAFAMPGGIVVVHTGLIAATRRPEELAGVLAHEVQHVEQRHSLQGLIKDLGLRGIWLLVTGDIGSGLVGQAALEITSLQFSRDAESQADARGFDTLIATGIDPSGMADFFQVMREKEGSATPPAFLSTHPASAAREQTLRARTRELSDRTFARLELGSWPPSGVK